METLGLEWRHSQRIWLLHLIQIILFCKFNRQFIFGIHHHHPSSWDTRSSTTSVSEIIILSTRKNWHCIALNPAVCFSLRIVTDVPLARSSYLWAKSHKSIFIYIYNMIKVVFKWCLYIANFMIFFFNSKFIDFLIFNLATTLTFFQGTLVLTCSVI